MHPPACKPDADELMARPPAGSRRSGSDRAKKEAAGKSVASTSASSRASRARTTGSGKDLTAASTGVGEDLFARGPSLAVRPSFEKAFADEETFGKTPLAGVLAPFGSHSTHEIALTRNPLVLVRVTDNGGNPIPEVRLELFDEQDRFLDAVASDSIGLGLLRWPSQPPAAGSPKLEGTVRAGGAQDTDVVVPAGEDFVVVPIELGGAPPVLPGEDSGERHDSVIPRLPAFFGVTAADEIVRHRAVADGPDPCFHDAMQRQCTYRAPRVRWIYVRRTVYGDRKLPRRLYVRVRQEWHFVGHSFGQPERIDSRDVASLVGALDANLQAQLAVTGRLDVSTASVLSADASGRLRAAASLDGELDASVGLQLFEGGLGNPLSVSGDADVSIDTSLLVSAQLKLRASLRNQLHARASLSGRASLGFEADASVSVNPSLSRELNMPRFVVHENYVVSSFVEDVQEIREIEMFEQLKEETIQPASPWPHLPFPSFSLPLFPPADVVEYRPIFERKLLEPSLAGRFRALRNALDTAAGRGPLVRRLRFDVAYSATCPGWLQVQIGDRHAKVSLREGGSVARVALDLPAGEYLQDLNRENVHLHVTMNPAFPDPGVLPPPGMVPWGTIRIRHVTASSEASSQRQSHTFPDPPFEASGVLATASREFGLVLPPTDAGLMSDPLVVHINRNPTYYMGLLVKAALANPSLRFDVSQLQRIGPDNVLWRLPIHGFAGNKALVMVPAGGKEVELILGDLGRATVVQLAVDGNWSEAMQGESAVTDALGKLFPGIENLTLPVALLEGLGEGNGLVSSIVDAAAVASGLGGGAGTVPGAGIGGLGTIAEALDF